MKRNCTTCNWANFEWKGKRRNLESGECCFNVVLPLAFANYMGHYPRKRRISKYFDEECLCWLKGNKCQKEAANEG